MTPDQLSARVQAAIDRWQIHTRVACLEVSDAEARDLLDLLTKVRAELSRAKVDHHPAIPEMQASK